MKRNTSGLRRGGPGRKKGVPNRVTLEAKAFCRRLIEDPAYVEKFERDFRARKLPVRLEEMVWAYAFGRPKQDVELSAQLTLEDIVCGLREPRDPDAGTDLPLGGNLR